MTKPRLAPPCDSPIGESDAALIEAGRSHDTAMAAAHDWEAWTIDALFDLDPANKEGCHWFGVNRQRLLDLAEEALRLRKEAQMKHTPTGERESPVIDPTTVCAVCDKPWSGHWGFNCDEPYADRKFRPLLPGRYPKNRA